ncbi:LPS export ABC transporter permease LptF [Citreimonas salinaria]|uniref:Lipopolysaccharide export system permease protein n=1 Tax=Citreimonas salinaria TaxID=321339 RepID=A0A1H3H0A7_9RHOB|nr:LPS export ABC transporter permease LptF [Citreimonas salinaria]SDY08817.1 lipopolysaccharide export system permease protein [Citreimonas salinaria]
MQRFDRYVLSQLMVLFGFFALVLVAVYWVNRAVILFDRLIADGHSAGIFLEFTALSLPQVVALVLPMAAFAAAVYVANRLSNESELTVVQAAGLSPWRLARPVMVFGVLVMLMTAVLTHALIPAAREQLREREAEISGSVSARLLREGTFLHPIRGVTLYMREISPEGELSDVLLADRRNPAREVTYTAERAYVVRDDEGPKLLMVAGLAQTLDVAARRLSTTTFTDLTYDVSGLVEREASGRRRIEFIPTWELLTHPERSAEQGRKSVGEVLEEAHMRFQQPILALVAALVGFAALNSGTFSRFGVGRRIVGAILLLVIIKLVESVVTDPVRTDARLWPLIYLPSVVGLLMVVVLLARASNPFAGARRRAARAPA